MLEIAPPSPTVGGRRALAILLVGSLLTTVVYLGLFHFVLTRPMTLGDMTRMIDRKEKIAESVGPGAIIIAAGSNGRYSHSCATLSELLDRPCANMGVAASIQIDFLFDWVEKVAKPGDLVYVPLEYPLWSADRSDFLSDDIGPAYFSKDVATLRDLGWDRLAHGAFAFNVRFAIESVFEKLLVRMGVARRVGVTASDLNDYGDMVGHDAKAAAAYTDYLSKVRWRVPDNAISDTTRALVGNFIKSMKDRGVVVVGGLSTTFDDQPVPDSVIAPWRALFEDNGAAFIMLPNKSQYPRSEFFDTTAHLQQQYQIEHSAALAPLLRPLLPPLPAGSGS
ncbi:MAG TPA: hypothetical protein VNX29_10945 [Kaistia sp.]|nr:hypothetical protein [Kaistia sp.]